MIFILLSKLFHNSLQSNFCFRFKIKLFLNNLRSTLLTLSATPARFVLVYSLVPRRCAGRYQEAAIYCHHKLWHWDSCYIAHTKILGGKGKSIFLWFIIIFQCDYRVGNNGRHELVWDKCVCCPWALQAAWADTAKV